MGPPVRPAWDKEWPSLVAAFTVWGCLVGLLLFGKIRKGVASTGPVRDFALTLLPVSLYLGGRRALLCVLTLFIIAAPMSIASHLLKRWQKERLSKRGIHLGEAQEVDLSSSLMEPSPLFLICSVILMLYGQTILTGLVAFLLFVMLFVHRRFDRMRQ